MRYMAFDPGGTTGFAILESGNPVTMGQIIYSDVLDWILRIEDDIKLFVIEDYIIRPATHTNGYAHQWNKGYPLRVLGALELRAKQLEVPVVLQQPAVKPQASQLTGLSWEKGRHDFDAVLHGMWYWFKKHGPEGMKLASNETESGGGDTSEPGVGTTTRVAQISSLKGLRAAGNKKRVGMSGEEL